MQIKMLVTADGASDGFTVRTYAQDQVYPQVGFPVSDDLAAAFIAGGVAVDPAAAENIDAAGAQIAPDANSAASGGDPTDQTKPAPAAKSGRRTKG